MVEPLFDTNILIDYLCGIDAAQQELARYKSGAISIVTWMEVLVGASSEDEAQLRAWLDTFRVIELDEIVAMRAVEIRRLRKVRLPDAIVWASAQVHSLVLV